MSENIKKIQSIANELSKKFKSKVLSDVNAIKRHFISTGNPLIDWVFGKGIPLGKVIEIFGEEGVGKSTLAYHILAECYRQGGIPILFDTEESFSSERAKVFGLEHLIIEVPETIEQSFEMLLETMDKMEESDFGVVVWDSLAATPPQSRLEGKQEIGAKARVVSDYLQILLKKMEKTKLSLIILNQVRSIIAFQQFGLPQIEAPSARALKHEAVIRAQLTKSKVIKVDDIPVGIVVNLTTHKNKIVSPYRIVKLMLFFEKGISVSYSVLQNAVDFEIVKQDRGWLEFEGVKFRWTEIHKLKKEHFDLLMQRTLNELQARYEKAIGRYTL